MKKLVALVVFLALLLGAYVAAGPFLAMHQIRTAVQEGDTRSLSEHVDFELIRSSVRAQVEDHIARQADTTARGSPLGRLMAQVAGRLGGGAIDALVTPAGIGALLQGRHIVERFAGLSGPADGEAFDVEKALDDARYRYESTSRFTATIRNADGVPIVFVFTREGLDWMLTDIRLPIGRLLDSLAG